MRRILALALLVFLAAAAPALAGNTSGSAALGKPLKITFKPGTETVLPFVFTDSTSRPLLWVTSERCWFEQFDATKPAVKLFCEKPTPKKVTR